MNNINLGPFGDLVANAGAIMAMAVAIGFAWRGRSKWEPSEDDVPKAPQKVASMFSAVAIVVIWATLRGPEHKPLLSILALVLGLVCVLCLGFYVFIIARYTYKKIYPKGTKRVDQRNIIGGFRLSEESRIVIEQARSQGKAPPSENDLFKGSGYDEHRVWTPSSRALAKVFCIFGYVGLLITGTIALASAAIIVGIQMKAQNAPAVPAPVNPGGP